ncbi:hypothetical protein H4219_003898 [Mycoemilia scoparia]|uniref:Letm1 RBD domain-containing protein n=1 Tax=Mycoemilia scoparia TaxID=417184 RepID=A0A9W7ZXP3_9FUNG|nr:hypothetical protein H4219_003898 [Mycoemilia scoparia]
MASLARNALYRPTSLAVTLLRSQHLVPPTMASQQKYGLTNITVFRLYSFQSSAKAATSTEKPAVIDPTATAEELSLYQKIKAYMNFYKQGCKQLYQNQKESKAISKRIADGEKITRKEFQIVQQAKEDFWKMIPFGLLVVILPESIPLFVAFIPAMVPSTCVTYGQRAKMLKKKDAIYKSLNSKMIQTIPENYSVSANDFKTLSGLKTIAQKDLDIFSTTKLSGTALDACLSFMSLSKFGTASSLRSKLNSRIEYLNRDDMYLLSEDLNELTHKELVKICVERGIPALGLSDTQMRNQIQKWLSIRKQSGDISPLVLTSSKQVYSDITALTEQLKKEAQSSVGEFSDVISDNFSAQLSEVIHNQKTIEQLTQRCIRLSQDHEKSNQKWTKMVSDFYTALKELGDVQNWAQVIEKDMRDVAATLEIAHTGTT